MNTIFNFGDVHKDFKPIAKELFGNYETISLPITNIKIYKGKEAQLVSACYGQSLARDSLAMMRELAIISSGDRIIFLGSMGSLSKRIKTGDFVIPSKVLGGYLVESGLYKEKELFPDPELQNNLEKKFTEQGVKLIRYVHGASSSVFDPTVDVKNYRCTYPALKEAEGLDLESYAALAFCKENKIKAGLLFYCADDPSQKIHRIPKEEFNRMARENDKIMNRIAYNVLMNIK